MRYTKRIYHDRQPEVGDTIVAIDNCFSLYQRGNELRVVDLADASGVGAINKRTGNLVYINDKNYRIYTDIIYEKSGEQHVVKRIFGIPFYKKTIDIYEEV